MRIARERRKNPSEGIDYLIVFNSYDQVGNRIKRTQNVTDWFYTYDNNDKLTKMGTTSGGSDLATFGHDNNGNMTSASGTLYGSWSLGYDDESRLVSVMYPGLSGPPDHYSYNALGHRMRARLDNVWQRYVYNGDRVLEERTDAGSLLARHTTESGSYYDPWVHMWRTGNVSRFPLMDGVGTTRRLVDQNNNHTDSYELTAFGDDRGSTTTTTNPYQFGGAWGYISDPSGLLQLGARFYWPEVGRFVQQDPAKHGINWYAYVDNRPTIAVDATGLHTTGRDCANQYRKDLRRCAEDAKLAGIVGGVAGAIGGGIGGAVAGGGAGSAACPGPGTVAGAVKGGIVGGAGGYLGGRAAGSWVVRRSCDARALEDLQDCINEARCDAGLPQMNVGN